MSSCTVENLALHRGHTSGNAAGLATAAAGLDTGAGGVATAGWFDVCCPFCTRKPHIACHELALGAGMLDMLIQLLTTPFIASSITVLQ